MKHNYKMTRQQIAESQHEKIIKESSLLEGKDFSVLKDTVDRVKATLNEYLDSERTGGSSTVEGIIEDLFNCSFDIESEIWGLEYDSIDLLKSLIDPAVIQALGEDRASRAVKMLYNINRFAKSLNDNYRIAELKLGFLNWNGEGNIIQALCMENEYLVKLKARDAMVEMLAN